MMSLAKNTMIAACVLVSSANLLANLDTKTVRNRFGDPDARYMMEALKEAGVFDTDRVDGELNLRVNKLDCQEYVVQHPKPVCTINFNGESLGVTGAKAKSLFMILKEHGSRVPTGRGVRKYNGNMIHCVRPDEDGAESHCELDVPARR